MTLPGRLGPAQETHGSGEFLPLKGAVIRTEHAPQPDESLPTELPCCLGKASRAGDASGCHLSFRYEHGEKMRKQAERPGPW
jgi:hypothetical protein